MKMSVVVLVANLVCCSAVWGSQKFGLNVPEKSTRPVLYYADQSIEAGNAQAEYAVVLVHGIGGATADCTTTLRSSIKSRYPDEFSRTVFFAPAFLSDTQLSSPLCDTYAYWEGSKWSSGYDSPVVENLSSYDVMDCILGHLADATKYPQLKHVFVGGFSAGGQYTVRYVCVGNYPRRAGVRYDFAPGGPSSYLYLDNNRIAKDGTWRPFATVYPGYNNWKYGLDNRNRYASQATLESILQNLASCRVLSYCGTADNDPNHHNLDKAEGAMAQGKTRYQRFLNFQTCAVEHHPDWYSNYQFIAISGVAHDSSACYKKKRIVNFALGKDVGSDPEDPVPGQKLLYVDASAAENGDGLSEETAVRSLQQAVTQANAGDRILVAPGVYSPVRFDGKRVVVEGRTTGGEVVIDGGGTNRCVHAGPLINEMPATFRNLTLRNGYGGNGGGAYRGIFENCTFVGNVATNQGGAAYRCTLTDCLVMSNTASIFGGGVSLGEARRTRFVGNVSTDDGGAAYQGMLFDSLVVGNRAEGDSGSGGGCCFCTNVNCTIYGNFAGSRGGGIYGGRSRSCIVWGNSAVNSGDTTDNHGDIRIRTNKDESCKYCLSGGTTTGTGNLEKDPLFVAPERGDFRLQTGSPCIDAGQNSSVDGTTDLLGHVRIQNGTVDIGACEGVADTTITTPVEVPYAWLDRYPTLLEAFSGDYELAAHAKTGKRTASGADLCVWEDYVAGTDPTNVTDVLTASIDVADERVTVTYSPVVTNEAGVVLRKYTTWGKTNLLEKCWSEVPVDGESDYRFFKVSVDML